MSHLARTFARIGSREALYWIFPLTAGAGWLVWPAVDDDWKLERGLMRDPEADVNYVANLKKQRLEAYQALHPKPLKLTVKVNAGGGGGGDDEEENEDEEEEGAGGGEDSDETGGEGGGDDGEEGGDDEEEEEEESEIKIPPLFAPAKGQLGKEDLWDNFSLKALKMTEDDDDDDEDEEEEEEE